MLSLRTARIVAALVAIMPAAAPDAAADLPLVNRTPVRSGNHPDFGRVVVDTIGQAGYRIEQNGDHVVVRFDDGVSLGTPPALPRNVTKIKTSGAIAELTLKHGSVLHATQLGGRVVLDALDPSGKAPVAPKRVTARPPPSGTTERAADERAPASLSGERTPGGVAGAPADHQQAAQPHLNADPARLFATKSADDRSATVQEPPPLTAAAQATTPAPAPTLALAMSAERVPVEAQPLPSAGPQPAEAAARPNALPENVVPIGLRVRRVKLPKDIDGSAILVPFDATTAAAAFQTARATYLAFDERRPIDLAALRNDPVFGEATVQLLSNGTLLRVALPAGLSVALTQIPQGWRIAALTAAPERHPIVAALADGHLALAAEQPGTVLTMADPETGATLLVGTQHRSGQGVPHYRRSAEFIMRPTIHGIVVEPLSDAIDLRPAPAGFILTGGPAGLLLSPAITATDLLMEASSLTKRLTLAAMPADLSIQQANKQLATAAATPPGARGPKHRSAAQTLLALGFSAEAEALLHMATEQDPREAASAETRALTAIAALLADRPDEAAALSDQGLDGSDEIAFWRTVRTAMRDEGSPAAAAVFATTAPLMAQYPGPIRAHLLPIVVETMTQGGEIAPAARLLNEYKDSPNLAYARALMRQAEGNTGEALAMLDALAVGHDQFDRARAAVRAVELRLAARTIDKPQAADALDKLLYTWRGDGRELGLRQRIAELRSQSGQWRAALATLRQAETDFPEQDASIHQRLQDMFAAMARDEGASHIPPIEFVSMVDENADLIPETSDDEVPVQQALADRLAALDLPGRAKPVLEKLLRTAKSDIPKAQYGASLAALESREGNDAAARDVLGASDARVLPPDLAEQRAILLAEAVARLGDRSAAAGLLAPFTSTPAMDARAQILEGSGRWADAAKVWMDIVTATVPDTGPLDDAGARTVLRLATATAHAGDDAALADLRVKFGGRFSPGPVGDLFRVLTAEPIRTSADIGRSHQETGLAATLPGGLKALPAIVTIR